MARPQDVLYATVRFPRTEAQGGTAELTFKLAQFDLAGSVLPIESPADLADPLQALQEGWSQDDNGLNNWVSLEHGTNAFIDAWCDSSDFGIFEGSELFADMRTNSNACFTGGFSARIQLTSPRASGQRANSIYVPEVPQTYVDQDTGVLTAPFRTGLANGMATLASAFDAGAPSWSLAAVHASATRVRPVIGWSIAQKASFLQRRYR